MFLSMATNRSSVICPSILVVLMRLTNDLLICSRVRFEFFVVFFPVDRSEVETLGAFCWYEVEGCDDGEVVGL